MTTHEDRARQILDQAARDNAEHPIGIDKHRVFRIAEALAEGDRASWPGDVLEWHEAMGLDCTGDPHLGSSLIDEEATELDEALLSGNRAQILKESLDLVWVVLGNLNRHGINPRQVTRGWRELERSNWTKVGGPLREDGKILKPETFEPADMARVLGVET